MRTTFQTLPNGGVAFINEDISNLWLSGKHSELLNISPTPTRDEITMYNHALAVIGSGQRLDVAHDIVSSAEAIINRNSLVKARDYFYDEVATVASAEEERYGIDAFDLQEEIMEQLLAY